MHIVSREVQGGTSWELLYADDLVLMAESEVVIKQKLQRWKSRIEAMGLRVNVGKTEVMTGSEGSLEEFGSRFSHLCGGW